ncbi:MAG: hypothetical protein J6V72_18835, partial [Kiritimatiellae bacterium]|nr:hypothetical protein [Kiritimatiellia bacterium]
MKVRGLIFLCGFVGVAQAASTCVELNTGWRFVRDEPIAVMREFGIPAMIDWLDDMGRDLL